MADYGIKTEEYSRSVQERFSEDGRIFLVDYSKHCAAKVLQSLAEKGGFSSFLLVVKNLAVAEDFEKILKPVLGEVGIVASYADWLKVMGENLKLQVETLRAQAEQIRSRQKNLIFVANEKSGETLLNRKLCVNTQKDGSYGNNDVYADYCISDLLADCCYDFVVVDDIYSMFSLKEGGRDETKLYSPGKHERLDFLGNGYYAETEHSYKRLRNLMASAEKRMAIADVVASDSVATLYAAMDCVYSDFSLVKERKAFTNGRYSAESEIQQLHTEIAYCRDDEDLIGAWADILRGRAGWHPEDNRALQQFFTVNLDFTSQAEMTLRVVSVINKLYYGGKFPGIENIVEQLAETEPASKCLAETFFSGGIKAELEAAAGQEARTEKLSASQLAEVFKVFLKYGVYHYFSGKDAETKVLRILRDNSGFEHFLRRHTKERIEDDYTYSVLHKGSDKLYKCVETARLCDGRERTFAFDFPVVVVVNSKVAETQRILTEILKTVRVDSSVEALERAKAGEKLVVVTDYQRACDSAVAWKVSSAIFMDVASDPVRLKLLANKMLAYGAKNLFVLASYGDLSAHVMDAWQNLLFSNDRALPFINGAIEIKEGTVVEYASVTARVEEVYTHLRNLVIDGRPHHVEEMPSLFNSMIVDYTLRTSFQKELICLETEYLARLGRAFEAVFENTSAVGDVEDETVVQRRKYVEIKDNEKQKNAPQFKEEISEVREKRTYYNACMKVLRGSCDLKKNNCADCADYKQFKTNDVQSLRQALAQFFEEGIEQTERLEKIRERMKNDGTIAAYSLDDDFADGESGAEKGKKLSEIDRLKENQAAAMVAMEAIEASDEGHVFIADSEYAQTIRNSVYSVYRNLLYKYYAEIRNVFNKATKEALSAYENTKQCAVGINGGR